MHRDKCKHDNPKPMGFSKSSAKENVPCALKKKVKFIVFSETPYRYQLGLTGPLYLLRFVFPC